MVTFPIGPISAGMSRVLALGIGCCWLLLVATPAWAQTSVLPASLPGAWNLQRPDSSYASSQIVGVTDQPFGTAVRVSTFKRPDNTYNVQLSIPTSAAVSSNDVLQATFYLRRVSPVNDDAFAAFIFERAGAPYEKSASRTFNEGAGAWHRFRYAFAAVTNYAAGQAQVNFPLGFDPQVVEIGGVALTNYFKTVAVTNLDSDITYAGRAPDAAWRVPAAQRIEQLRKADLTVLVQDERGTPLAGAEVSVRMTRHAFPFGSAVDGSTLLGAGLSNDLYRGVVTNWFNRVVLENDLKWPNFAGNPQRAISSVKWLRDRDIEVRGHNLLWPAWRWMPSSVAALSNNPSALRIVVSNRVASASAAFAGQLVDWDVVNEPYSEHDVMDVLGNAEMIQWFKTAKQNDPFARLYVNDYGNLEQVGTNTAHQTGFYHILGYLVTNGAPVEGIGLQGHFGSFLSPPDQILALFDRYGSFGLPLQVTEFDIDTTDTAVQADYTRDFLTVAFSHPSVDGVLMWGFWEGRHWLPDAALFRRDWTIKPNGMAWTNQVFGQWWTKTNGVAASDGRLAVRGFKGDYEVAATLEGVTQRVSARLRTNQTVVVTLTNPPVRLTATRTNGVLRVVWPAHGDGATVETTENLDASWTNAPEPTVLTNGEWRFQTAPGSSNRYFRLKR
jgi:endo-1,4-beta-xylanase